MRSPGLVVMGVAALAVVGYAFYVLSDPAPDRPRPTKVRAQKKAEPRGDRRRPAPARRSGKAAAGSKRVVTPRVGKAPPQPSKRISGPPPRPKPEISLSEARTQFADLLAELDRLAAEDAELSSEQWVDYYKRGHDALLPLQQHLDWKVPDEADELRSANEDLRAKLKPLEPGYTPPTVPAPGR